MNGRLQLPMYTAAALAAANPLLLKGEVVYESDTRKRKVGDGISKWNDLAYDAGGDLPKMTPVAGADSVADFLGTSAPINDVLQKVIAATAIGKVRMVRFGGLQCMVWYIEGTTTVGVFGFVAENNAIAFGSVDDSEFPAGIFESTDEEIAAVVSYNCSFISLTAIPASYISTNTLYQFASATEKSTWNNKAAKDLSNVSLTKLFSENGYYKAPDGLMFQWGVFNGVANSTGATVYFPTAFAYTPYSCIITPKNGADKTVVMGRVYTMTTSYFKATTVWSTSSSNWGAEVYYWLAIGRWK